MLIVRLFHESGSQDSAIELMDVPCLAALADGMADSAWVPAEAFSFREVTAALEPAAIAGDAAGWHTAPYAQLLVVLEGGLKIASSSGDSYTFQAGEVLLVEDIDGPGHQTWNYEGRRLHVKIARGTCALTALEGIRRRLTT